MTPATDNTSDRSTPRVRRPAVSSEAVLDAAEALLDQGGFDELSVRSVAKQLGASRQIVYTHFGGMDGLLDGLHQRLSARLGHVVDALAAGKHPTGSTNFVLASAASYRSVARQWPELYQLVFERPIADFKPSPMSRQAGLDTFGRIVKMSGSWLGANRPAASRRPQADLELARAIWSTIHGFVVVERVGFATLAETDALSDQAIRSMLDGWAID